MANERHIVTYNSYALQSTPDRETVGESFQFVRSDRDFFIAQNFVIFGTSDTDFNSKIQAAEIALNKANAAVSVSWENQTSHSFDPSANTGFLTRGKVSKVEGSKFNLQRSREYRFEVTGMLPASEFRTDAAAKGYLETQVQMVLDSTRRPTFVFSGEYRAEKDIAAGGVKAASTTYLAATNGAKDRAAAWLNTNAGTFSGSSLFAGDASTFSSLTNYELINEQFNDEDQDKKAQYQLSFRFRGIPETAADGADSKFTIERCEITYDRTQRFASREAAQDISPTPPQYKVQFDIKCNFTLVGYKALTSPSRTGMAALYTNELKPFLAKHLDDVWGAGSNGAVVTPGPVAAYILTSESAPAETSANTMSVTWMVQSTGNYGLIAMKIVNKIQRDLRKTHVKRADGQEHTYDSYSPGERRMAVQDVTGTVVAGKIAPQIEGFAPFMKPVWAGSGTGWELLDESVMTDAGQMYAPDGSAVRIIDFSIQRQFLWRSSSGGGVITPYGPGAAGAGGGTPDVVYAGL